MMKTCFMKTALLVLLAGVTLSAGAKPAEMKLESMVVLAGRQSGDLTVALRGFAGTVLGPKKDTPVSCATPTQKD